MLIIGFDDAFELFDKDPPCVSREEVDVFGKRDFKLHFGDIGGEELDDFEAGVVVEETFFIDEFDGLLVEYLFEDPNEAVDVHIGEGHLLDESFGLVI